MREAVRSSIVALLLWVGAGPAALANLCPLPPNPNFPPCPLAVDRPVLTEEDVDGDDMPDNFGSVGGFCGGDSPADCVGFASSEVGLDLVIPNPGLQDVTCTATGLEIWIMSDLCGGCLATGFESVTLPAGTTTDGTLKVVVADVNGDVCPCGPLLTCTYAQEAVCNDDSDGDGDGLIDEDDPDCCLDQDGDGFCGAADCDDTNLMVHASSGEIAEIALGRDGSDVVVSWSVEPFEVVDVISGPLSDLTANRGFSLAGCLVDDGQGSSFHDTRPDPPSGEADYYLARAQNPCGAGSFGASSIAENPRAQLDGSSPCPYDPLCPSCEFCDLLDPLEVCTGQHCQPTGGFPETVCQDDLGSGFQDAPCADVTDCGAGYTCSELFGTPRCRRWCEDLFSCGTSETCTPLTPPVIVGGESYGVCVSF